MSSPYHNPMVGFNAGVGTAPMSNYGQTPTTQPLALTGGAGVAIDGTPTRVGTIVILMIGAIALFHYGFDLKFNVAAS